MYNSSISTISVCLYSNQQYYGCYRLTIQTPPLKQLLRKAGRKQSHVFCFGDKRLKDKHLKDH